MKMNLNPREILGMAFSGAIVLLTLFMLVYLPTGPRKAYQQSNRDLASAQNELRQIQILQKEETQRLLVQEELMKKLEKRSNSFNFFTYMNAKLQLAKLHQHKPQLTQYTEREISDRQPMVRVQLTGINLEELVTFLHIIYNNDDLVVLYKVDQIRAAQNKKGLECNLIFATLRP